MVITDGEPTAHFEDGQVEFSYPPTRRTIQETLREVQRCTKDGITINTFMLERSRALAEFVAHMTRLNRGRAFYATPEHLGEYVLVDFVSRRTKRVGVGAYPRAASGGPAAVPQHGGSTSGSSTSSSPFLLFLHVMGAILAFGPTFAYSIMGAMAGQGAAARQLQRAPGRGHRQQAGLPAGDLPGDHRRPAHRSRPQIDPQTSRGWSPGSSCTSITSPMRSPSSATPCIT